MPTGLLECCQYQYRRRFDCISIILSRHAPVRVADGSFGGRGGDLARKCMLDREGQCMMWAKQLKKNAVDVMRIMSPKTMHSFVRMLLYDDVTMSMYGDVRRLTYGDAKRPMHDDVMGPMYGDDNRPNRGEVGRH